MAGRRMRLGKATVAALRPEAREYTVRDTLVPGLGVRVRPTGARTYVHCVGGRRVALGPATLMDVGRARRECMAREIGGDRAGSGRMAGRAPVFREFVAGPWKAAWYDGRKPLTRRSRDWVLNSLLLPAFGSLRLDRIGRAGVERWFDKYSRAAPGGANMALGVLRQILRHAVACGHIAADPTAGIRRNPRPVPTRFLSAEEIARLHGVLDGEAERDGSRRSQADIIRLLLLTGCRRGEIVRLRWGEVGGDMLNLADGKTGPRAVPLNGRARGIIAGRRRTGSPWVFPSPLNPDLPLSPNLPLWRRIRREAGLEDVRLHDLRHTFASQAVLHGVPLPVVAQLLGHRSVSMTMRYAHVADRDAEAAAERVGSALAAAMDGEPPGTGAP